MISKIGKYRLENTDDGHLIVSGKQNDLRTVEIPTGEFIEVRSAWYVDQLPTKIVIELLDNSLEVFNLSPVKKITYRDLRQYKGLHPRELKADPLPEMLYQYYGLTRFRETLSEIIKVRLKPSEKEKLGMLAASADVSVSELLRDYITKMA